MNIKIVLFILGRLLIIEGIFMGISSLVSLFYNDSDFIYIISSSAITISIGLTTFLLVKKNIDKNLKKREGFLIVSLVWVLFSFFGALPYYLSGSILSYTDAFFETMSGFTTTGATILNDIESLSHGLLFWRSLTQWLGGMGIIVLSIAILPLLGVGGMQLFVAESPGPTLDKLHPRIQETAKRLWGLYIGFTIAEILLLSISEMSWFDAINHSFTTMASGGYSTKQASIAHWDSPYIHYVITLFMFIAGINFSLSYFAVNFKFKKVLKNEEFRLYIITILVASTIGTIILFINGDGLEYSFRESIFQVVSIITTTGYVTVDYLTWPPLLLMILFTLMFFGSSAGSTSGGIKLVRILIVFKNSAMELKRLIHPKAIIPIRLNKTPVEQQVVTNVLAFIALYIMTFVVGVLIMTAEGLDLESAMGAAIATLGNVGPGIGKVGPAETYAFISDFEKWVLSFLMLLGRLELFTVIVLFSPYFWKK